jgi:ribosome recycling factor
MITINGNNHIITREADVITLTVNEDSSLKLIDVAITDNAVNFAPNRYDALLKAKYQIALCL